MLSTKIKLSPDQDVAVDKILHFWKQRSKTLLTMGGYGGTGKTTSLGEAVRLFRKESKDYVKIAFACFTGKASQVLHEKLTNVGALDDGDYCGTIHRLIYRPSFDSKGRITGWRPVDSLDCDLIVVDEASMVNRNLFDDLRGYQKPILAVGDHGQLPPIKGDFNLMDNPEIRLEKIHRQVENDPIIKMSIMARQDGHIPVGEYGPHARKITDREILNKIDNPDDVMVICGYNRSRVTMNQIIRYRTNRLSPHPIVGDKLICLRNNSEAGIFNGMLGVVEELEEHTDNTYWVRLDMGDFPYCGEIFKDQFNQPTTISKVPGWTRNKPIDLFDYGYAMTCWKAQGGEHRRVIVFEQRNKHMTDDLWKRWLYTSISRATERLIVVGQ